MIKKTEYLNCCCRTDVLVEDGDHHDRKVGEKVVVGDEAVIKQCLTREGAEEAVPEVAECKGEGLEVEASETKT